MQTVSRNHKNNCCNRNRVTVKPAVQNAAGFTVLIAVLVATIVLAIGLAILDITLKQVKLAGIAEQSERAFHAAQAGYECARYYDLQNGTFDIPNSGGTVTCFGSDEDFSAADSGDEQRVFWTWGAEGNKVCSDVSVYKFYSASGDADMDSAGVTSRDCPEGFTCTVVRARGYNDECGVTSEDVVEREITVVY